MPGPYHVETFSEEERAVLARHVSDVDGPVFALTAWANRVEPSGVSRGR